MGAPDEDLRRFDTDLVPDGVEYEVVRPKERGSGPLPLVLALHGGNGHVGFATLLRWRLESLWANEEPTN